MNQVNIIGDIGREPEVKSFQSGKKTARFSVTSSFMNRATQAYSQTAQARVESGGRR
ncbi:MAG: single-stranded DNA-binding protein [Candidatus Melainabacteria bacterium]|nr:single-stranded DNA-binding protein [Candidatus Melainabacteria bacterium]